MRRVYFISIRTATGLLTHQWQTTSSILAMEFTHSFGTVGFGLFSKVVESPEINYIDKISIHK